MLTWLGVFAVVALLFLILFRITSPIVALTLVPVVAGLLGGFGADIGGHALEGMRNVAPIAVLLAFAVVYFGLMADAGLFDPVVRRVLGLVGGDPVKVAVGTAVIAAVTHLDGAGASTFMVTIPAMLPLYRRLGMSPLTLSCIAGLAAGTMNMLPWAGPATRAAAALEVEIPVLFGPVVPAMIAGLAGVLLAAVHLGRQERRRLGESRLAGDLTLPPAASRAASGWRRWFNGGLTVVTLGALFTETLPLPVVFVIAASIALVVNDPTPGGQRERLTAHASAAMLMVTTMFAAGVFTGILGGTGMLASMSADLVESLPGGVLGRLPLATAVASMPLSLAFDADSFYFGLLPVLAGASQAAGGSAVEVGRAALLGQMTTGFPVSPLTPATFLLIGLAEVDLAAHQRRMIPYAFGVTLIMTITAWLSGAV